MVEISAVSCIKTEFDFTKTDEKKKSARKWSTRVKL
jgi:hypothetical protein